MLQIVQDFLIELSHQPLWVQIWVNFLGAVNFAAVFFIHRSRIARIVLLAIVVAFVLMMVLYANFGYVKLLGLPHVLLWTPMLVYIGRHLRALEPSRLKKYLVLVTATNFISLLFDYVDVAKYLMARL